MVAKPKPKPDPDRPGVFLPNGAQAKAGLNKAILGSCWGQVADMVTYKAAATPQRGGSGQRAHHVPALSRLWSHRTRKPSEPSGLRMR
jgi:hypothetical protein